MTTTSKYIPKSVHKIRCSQAVGELFRRTGIRPSGQLLDEITHYVQGIHISERDMMASNLRDLTTLRTDMVEIVRGGGTYQDVRNAVNKSAMIAHYLESEVFSEILTTYNEGNTPLSDEQVGGLNAVLSLIDTDRKDLRDTVGVCDEINEVLCEDA